MNSREKEEEDESLFKLEFFLFLKIFFSFAKCKESSSLDEYTKELSSFNFRGSVLTTPVDLSDHSRNKQRDESLSSRKGSIGSLKFGGSSGTGCPVCSQPVYFAEQVISLHAFCRPHHLTPISSSSSGHWAGGSQVPQTLLQMLGM